MIERPIMLLPKHGFYKIYIYIKSVIWGDGSAGQDACCGSLAIWIQSPEPAHRWKEETSTIICNRKLEKTCFKFEKSSRVLQYPELIFFQVCTPLIITQW